MDFLGMGKRSVTYTKVENGIKVVIKKERRGVQAKNFLQNEAKWLKILNKKGIGPKFVRSGKNCLVYRYVEGERILDWMENAEKEEIKRAFKSVLNQCRVMDLLNVNKEEMHNPYKHILIGKKEVKMIDFERCRTSEKPKNVTQFCQFITSKKVEDTLQKKGFRVNKESLLPALKAYKKSFSEEDFKKILAIALK